MKNRFFKAMAVAFVATMGLAQGVWADNAATISTYIQSFAGYASTSYSGNTVTVVGNSSATPNSGNYFELDIDAGVTVVWQAATSGITSGSLINLNGAGNFNVQGTIENIGTGRAITNNSTTVINVSGSAKISSSTTSNGTIYLVGLPSSTAERFRITGGTVENTSTSSSGHAIYNGSGTVTVSGGKVSSVGGYAINNNQYSSYPNYNYGIVNVSSSGTVTTTTGTAINNNSSCTLTVSGGAISATTGTAINNNSSGTATVSGGTISATTGTAISNSGTITISGNNTRITSTSTRTIYNSSTLNINNGTVENMTTTGTNGNAIYQSGSGAANINGGTIKSEIGNAIDGSQSYGSSWTVNISNGTVEAKGTGKSAIVITYSQTVTITGGTIKSHDSGYAIYGNSSGATIILGGDPTINQRIYVHADKFSVITDVANQFSPGTKTYTLEFPEYGPARVAVMGGRYFLDNFSLVNNDWVLDESGQNDLAMFRSVKVSFDLNGGTGTPPATIGVINNKPIPENRKPSTNGYTKAGYYNDGKWYTSLTGTTEFIFGTNGTVVNGERTLYLKWERIVVTFDANGGSVTPVSANPSTIDGRLTSLPTPIRDGYFFEGWFTAATGGTKVTLNQVYNANTTIYAHWIPITDVIFYSYIDENGDTKITNSIVTEITSANVSSIDNLNGWYIVRGNLTRNSALTVSGTAYIILEDGSDLKVTVSLNNAGINVLENNSLTIYAQSNESNMGKLTAKGYLGGSGIGGNGNVNKAGTIIINGGVVTAIGELGAGIGGGSKGNGGTTIINGGIVTATSYTGAGIGGGGNGGSGGIITINGGMVTATTDSDGAGIGGGMGWSNGGTITINGGMVVATGGCNGNGSNCGTGIGKSYDGEAGTFRLNGDAVVFTSSVGDNTTSRRTKGILFIGNTGTFYGTSVTINRDITIPVNHTLTIPVNSTFTIANDITLTNNGTITPANGSTIIINGMVDGANKIVGANVSGITLNNKITESITINATNLLATTGQEVEYAINTDNTAPASGWQTETLFEGLAERTTYYIFARSKSNDNFATGVVSAALQVKTMGVPVATDFVSVIPYHYYTGAAQGFDINHLQMGAVTVYYNGSLDKPINAGIYTITVDVTEGTEFVGATGIALGYYVIAKVTIDKPTVETSNFVYNGNEQGISITENSVYDITGDVSATNAGDYTATVSLNDNANYRWAGNGDDIADVIFNWSIAPATLIITAEDKTIFVNANEPTYTYTINGFVNGDTEDIISVQPELTLDRPFDNTNAGTFVIMPDGAVAANYAITYENGTLTVTAKQIPVLANLNFTIPSNHIYNGEAQGIGEVTSTIAGLGTITVRYNGDVTVPVNAGTYAMTAYIAENSEFVAITIPLGDYIIAKKTITITPTTGQGKVFGESDPELTFTSSEELVEGDSFSGSLERVSGENAGMYVITLGTLSAGNNYTLSLSTPQVNFTVKPTYIDANGETQIANTFTIINSGNISSINNLNGWYLVRGNLTRNTTLTVSGTAHIILEDGSDLKVTASSGSGINVSEGNSLTIYAQSVGNNTGKLTATNSGSYGAGIGGGFNYQGNVGTITINGGTVTATGGSYSAGIGGGDGGGGGKITINGGTVTAKGSTGIGGGYNGNGGEITISAGTIMATGSSGAGIGGNGGEITISGGTITATGGSYSAGIGGNGGTITISGGTVTAISNTGSFDYGAGIGGSTITISGGTVTAINSGSSSSGVGIGGGYNVAACTFTLGGNAVVFASNISTACNDRVLTSGILFMANIGSGITRTAGTIISADFPASGIKAMWIHQNGKNGIAYTDGNSEGFIEVPSVTVVGTLANNVPYIDENGASKTANYVGVIDSDNISAVSNLNGWYLVRGDLTRNTTLTVSGTAHIILEDGSDLKVILTSGASAGINVPENNNLTIYIQSVSNDVGKLTVKGAYSSPGIGGGGTTTINGGIITATGGVYGTGIRGSSITINGGTVTATGESYGIDGGSNGASTTFIMKGNAVVFASSVRATGENLVLTDGILFIEYIGTINTRTAGTIISANFPVNGITAIWVHQNGKNGIAYTDGNSEGFIEVPAVTVVGTLVNNVPYIDENGISKTANNVGIIDADNISAVSNLNGWYLVRGNLIHDLTLKVSGTAHLILEDGSDLNITGSNPNNAGNNNAGIDVSSGNSLNIYAQSVGNNMGKLTVKGNGYGAGIGSSGSIVTGTITINGGTVTAIGGVNGTGIDGRSITINGGTITATGGNYGVEGTFTLKGDAIVFASSVRNTSIRTKGILFIGNTGTFYGTSVTINQDVTIPASHTLTIPTNSTLTIADGVTFTNNGTITPANGSTIIINGMLDGTNKIVGANVDDITLNSKTTEIITVNVANTLATTGQEVEYAINSANTVPTSGWQTETTFTGLTHGTTYYVFARSKSNDNFATGTASAALQVTTMEIPTTNHLAFAIPTNHIYTGSALGFDINVDGMGTVTIYYNGSLDKPINVGTYAITADVAEGSEFVAATGIVLGNYVIAKATIAKPTIATSSFTYNASTQGVSITGNSAYDITGDVSATIVGSYTANVALNDKFNYRWAGNGDDVEDVVLNWSIIKATITKPTLAKSSFTYNASAQGINITENSVYDITGDISATIVGDYTATVALNDKANYRWAGTGDDIADIVLNWSIIKATIAKPTAKTTNIYSGTEQIGVAENAVYTITSSIPAINVGNYTATVALNDKANYRWAGTGDDIADVVLNWSITPATLTITADDKSIPVGANQPKYTYTATGFVNGETMDIITVQPKLTLSSLFDNSQTGTFVITSGGATAPNYTIVYKNGTLTVNPIINAEQPTVTMQPSDNTVRIGTTHNLSVSATVYGNGTLSYQWYRNTTASSINATLIKGATNATYKTPEDLEIGTYYYYAVITNTIADNDDGGQKTAEVMSNFAVFTVEDFPPIRAITVQMYDSFGDGWDNAALKISVNGKVLTSGARVVSGDSDTYTFNAYVGDVVEFNWVKGSNYDIECAFAAYYTDYPPSSAFNPAAGATNNTAELLAYKQYGGLGSVSNGALVGSFIVTAVPKQTPTIAHLDYDIPEATYNSAPQGIGSVTGAEGMGAITLRYNGSTTHPTNAGTYTVTAHIAEGMYFSAGVVELGSFVIAKAHHDISHIELKDHTVEHTGDEHCHVGHIGELPAGVTAVFEDNHHCQTEEGSHKVKLTFVNNDPNYHDFDESHHLEALLNIVANTPIISHRVNPSIGSIGVQTIGNAIVLTNLPSNAKVEVFGLNGKRVGALPATPINGALRITVQTKGVYVVKAGGQLLRVVVR